MKLIKSHNAKTDDWILKQHMPEEKIVEGEYKPKSVIQQDHIEEMFDMREMSVLQNMRDPQELVTENVPNVRILKSDQMTREQISGVNEIEIMDRLNRSIQQMPHRPTWSLTDTDITNCSNNNNLEILEKEEFYKWRKTIHAFQTNENISLTPYEKSLNVWRQLWHVIEYSDLICQIVDARDPLLFYCATIKSILSDHFKNKRMILLLNKSDLLTEDQRSHWWDYFNNCGIDVYFWSAIAADINSDGGDNNASDSKEETKICTYSELIGIFENYASKNQSEVYSVGMIGFPNVGKSSTLNQILQKKKVAVSATPGKTKHFQTFMLNTNIKLIDCPGLVFPTFVNSLSHIILAGVLPIDNIRDLSHAMQLMAARIPQYVFEYTYNIKIPTTKTRENPDYCDSEELLSSFSVMRGLLTSCGVGNLSESSKILLKDYISGKLVYVQPPPNLITPTDFNHYNDIKQILNERSGNSQLYQDQLRSKILKMSNMVDETNMEEKFQRKIDKNANKSTFSANPLLRIDFTNKHWRKQAKKKKGKLRRKYQGTPYDDV